MTRDFFVGPFRPAPAKNWKLAPKKCWLQQSTFLLGFAGVLVNVGEGVSYFSNSKWFKKPPSSSDKFETLNHWLDYFWKYLWTNPIIVLKKIQRWDTTVGCINLPAKLQITRIAHSIFFREIPIQVSSLDFTWHNATSKIFNPATWNAPLEARSAPQEEVHRQDQEDLPENLMSDVPPESTMEPLPKETPAFQKLHPWKTFAKRWFW